MPIHQSLTHPHPVQLISRQVSKGKEGRTYLSRCRSPILMPIRLLVVLWQNFPACFFTEWVVAADVGATKSII